MSQLLLEDLEKNAFITSTSMTHHHNLSQTYDNSHSVIPIRSRQSLDKLPAHRTVDPETLWVRNNQYSSIIFIGEPSQSTDSEE